MKINLQINKMMVKINNKGILMCLLAIVESPGVSWGVLGCPGVIRMPNNGSGTPRPKTISARDSSARTFRPIFQSGTARPTLVGPLGPFFFFWGGGGGNLLLYSVMCIKTRFKKLYLT